MSYLNATVRGGGRVIYYVALGTNRILYDGRLS